MFNTFKKIIFLAWIGFFTAGFLFFGAITCKADYYDSYGYYHDNYGNTYAATGYYDIYGYFHNYSMVPAPVSEPAPEKKDPSYSKDGLRAKDPNGIIQYVPLFFEAKTDPDLVSHKRAKLDVTWVGQNPELPNGCEATALTTVLNYYGFDVDKMTVSKKFFVTKKKHVDFREFYVGNPADFTGLGCLAPAVVKNANAFLDQQETDLCAFNYSGYPFESLLNQVAKGFPVIIWVSQYMYEPFYGIRFNIDGEDIVWISQEHCLVMTGYDLKKKIVYVSDPLVGNTKYDIDLFKKRYTQLRYQAVIIKTAEEQFEEERDLVIWPFNDMFLPADKFVRGCKGFDGVSEAD